MSAASGISASQELLDQYAKAVDDASTRFLKIAIQNESLVPNGSWPKGSSDLPGDLGKLNEILEDNVPAYILARLDDSANGAEWLFISYVPDIAKIRDKMLYASSRGALSKALGGQSFKDTLFATSKADLTPTAYAAHLRHVSAPQPMSAREAELAEIQAAERQSGTAFEGSRARRNHVGTGVGLLWTREAENAIKDLVSGDGANLVILGTDSTENINLVKATSTALDGIPAALPTSDPSYSFFKWQPNKIVFIYACPSASKVKMRMIYSAGASSVVQMAQEIGGFKLFKKLETSEPKDLDLSFETEEQQPTPSSHAPPAFARPRGPPRKR